METEKTPEDTKVLLREKQTELIEIIEAFSRLEQTEEWETLKRLIFDKSLASIERQLLNETLNPEIHVEKIYKLQGEWTWAKQYSDLSHVIGTLKKQLAEIKKKLNE